MTKPTLATGKQIIRGKHGHIALRVGTLMTTDQEERLQAGVDAIEAMVEAEFEKLSTKVLRVEMVRR